MNVSRILFSVQILLTYPIECFVTREVVENSIIGRDPAEPVSQKLHYIITLSIVATTYLISMATDCLGVVLELNVRTFFWSRDKPKNLCYLYRAFWRQFPWPMCYQRCVISV